MAGVIGKGLHQAVSLSSVVLGLCAIGLATGLFQSPNNSAIMSSVPASKLGVASALLATVRNLGFVAGTGLSIQIFYSLKQITGSFEGSLHFIQAWAGGVSLLAAGVTLLKKDDSWRASRMKRN
jgi:hypothetical protein